MNELINKIESYNIFNYLVPGVLAVAILQYSTSISISFDNLFIGFFIYYFIGLVISRVGSLLIEPFLIKIRFLIFSNYKDYIIASRKDNKIELLSHENNVFRTYISMAVLVMIIVTTDNLYVGKSINLLVIGSLTLLLIVMLFSYKKQTSYIVKRIDVANVKDSL